MAALFDFLRRGRAAGSARQRVGRDGERAAERYLRKRGYRVLARNVAYREGEVDLVAVEKRSGTLCFVEVRSRVLAAGADAVVEPEQTVTPAKRRRVVAAARRFLRERRAGGRPMRFDVVAVRFAAEGDRRPDVRHYAGAFDAGGRAT